MAPKKKVTGLIKLQIKAGAANPAPPIGPALGQHGVNIMEFCKAYNAQTESQRGNVIPVEITVYEDRSFTFILKTPPAAELIKKAAGVAKGSSTPHTVKVAKLTMAQVREIAEAKQADLNANDIEAASKIIAGTAASCAAAAVASREERGAGCGAGGGWMRLGSRVLVPVGGRGFGLDWTGGARRPGRCAASALLGG